MPSIRTRSGALAVKVTVVVAFRLFRLISKGMPVLALVKLARLKWSGPVVVWSTGSKKFRLSCTFLRLASSCPIWAGLRTTVLSEGIVTTGPPGDLLRANSPRTVTGAEPMLGELRYMRMTVLLEATNGMVWLMSCIAWVASRPSRLGVNLLAGMLHRALTLVTEALRMAVRMPPFGSIPRSCRHFLKERGDAIGSSSFQLYLRWWLFSPILASIRLT